MKYESYLSNIAAARAAIEQSMLNGAVNGELLSDVYCIPSHNHQAFYAQVYGGEQYTLLYAKTLIADFFGRETVMHSFQNALRADKLTAHRGDILCGMKMLPLNDPFMEKRLSCLPSADEYYGEEGIVVDGVMTAIRSFLTGVPVTMAYHNAAQIKRTALAPAQKAFLDELYLHMEGVIGNLLDSVAGR